MALAPFALGKPQSRRSSVISTRYRRGPGLKWAHRLGIAGSHTTLLDVVGEMKTLRIFVSFSLALPPACKLDAFFAGSIPAGYSENT